MNNYEIIEKKIKEEIDKNKQKIKELIYKIDALKFNSLSTKLKNILLLGIVPYFILLLVQFLTFKFTSIPVAIPTLVTIILPPIIGLVTNNLLSKNDKKILKEFSTAKTSQEKLEEQTKYEIEKQKLLNYNLGLEKTLTRIEKEAKSLKNIPNKYHTTKKLETRSEEEIEINTNELNSKLENKNNELNIYTIKCYLKQHFGYLKNKLSKRNNILVKASYGIGGVMAYLFMPLMLHSIFSSGSGFVLSLVSILAGIGISSITSAIYEMKKQKNQLNVFEKLNNDLGEYRIKNEKEPTKETSKDLEKILTDLSIIKEGLEKEKLNLENKKSKEENKKEKEAYSYQHSNTGDRGLSQELPQIKTSNLIKKLKPNNE